jgi:hypothetical protein
MQRALAMAQQQYGSQASTILSAIKDAGATKTNTIRQARASAIYNSDAEQAGAQKLKAQLGQIGQAAQQNSGYADTLLAQPGATSATGPGSALLAANGNSRQNVPMNVASQQAEAIRQGNDRASRARSGGAFAEQAANATFEGNVQKLRDQLSGVQNQQGLKASTTYQDLLDKANRDTLAQQKLTDAESKDAYQKAHGLGGYKPAAVKKGPSGYLTKAGQNTQLDQIGKALGWIQKLGAKQTAGKTVREYLSTGQKVITGGTDAKPVYSTIPAFGNDLTRIAMDLYYNSPAPGHTAGTLTKTGRALLKKRGVKPPPAWTRTILPAPFGP